MNCIGCLMLPPLHLLPPFSVEICIVYLRKCLRLTYKDKEKRLILWFLMYLEGHSNEMKEGLSLFGTKFFYLVWEQIISDAVESNYSEYKSYLPKPTWDDLDQRFPQKAFNRPKPDILMDDGNFLHVIDAKEYDLHTSRPSLQDLWKQLYYGISLNAKMRGKSITNSLFFPSIDVVSEKCIDKFSKIYPLGFDEVEEAQVINAYLVDLKQAMNAYLGKENIREEISQRLRKDYLDLQELKALVDTAV